jgi:LacI family transcriptional regulator
VRPEKVARVRRAAAELGFRPNQFARLLRTRGTASMVGVVTANVGDPFWTGVLQGVEAVIGGGDRFILSASTHDRSDRESEIVAAMVERRVMALLVVPTALDQTYLGDVVATGTPVVCLDRPAVGADVDAVVADDVGGVRRGMDLLLTGGHRRIAFLGTGSIYTTAKRLEGYRQALDAAGITYDEALVHATLCDEVLVYPVIDELLALPDPPTAVFAANVNTSIGLLSGMRPRRWSPAIVAFSDFDAARLHDPAVTVVHNDPVAVGRRGAELALQRLDGYRGPARLVCIDTPIIERESHLVNAR